MDGHKKRAEKNKEKIRKAGIELFTKLGIKKVSMNDIAEKSNVSKVSIYNYFKSKDELLFDIIKTYTEKILEEIKNIIRSNELFNEKLKQIIYYKSKSSQLFKGEFLIHLLSNDPSIKDYYENVFKKESEIIMYEFFSEGKKLGYFSSNISIETIKLYIEIFQKGIENSIQILENNKLSGEIIELFFYGIFQK